MTPKPLFFKGADVMSTKSFAIIKVLLINEGRNISVGKAMSRNF